MTCWINTFGVLGASVYELSRFPEASASLFCSCYRINGRHHKMKRENGFTALDQCSGNFMDVKDCLLSSADQVTPNRE